MHYAPWAEGRFWTGSWQDIPKEPHPAWLLEHIQKYDRVVGRIAMRRMQGVDNMGHYKYPSKIWWLNYAIV